MNEQIRDLERYAVVGKIFPSLFHDILNPISGLMLYLSIIKDQINDETKEQMDLISESSDKIKDFIKIVQQFISSGVKETISIDTITQNVMKLMSVKAKYHNIKINFIRTTNIQINYPTLFLYQILINLISNSIDSFDGINREEKYINIIIENDEKGVQIKVVDNGKGISKENKSKIFKPFYTTKSSGTGTGLTNIKNIIENELGGYIKVDSEIDVGTQFTIIIPNSN